MRRRRFLASGLALAGSPTLAGCAETFDTDPSAATDAEPTESTPDGTTGTGDGAGNGDGDAPAGTPDGPPNGVYVQSFVESMSMQGTATSGDYAFALSFTVPHTFWTVDGARVRKKPATEAHSVHLMASVWDPDTETVLPETGLSVELRDGDELVSQEVIYPMLSQPMGFHYGGNFELPGDGTYTAALSVGGTSIRRTGAFAGRFGDPATVEIPLAFTSETRRAVATRSVEQAGRRGALEPRTMEMVPQSVAPAPEDLPGTVVGRARSDDADFVVASLETSPEGVSGEGYLAVSARTRYNGLLLPAMGIDATVTRDGETAFEGSLDRTLDPSLGYHYGASVRVGSGDSVTLAPTTPPQVARHEGYERAFLSFEEMRIDV